MLCFGVVTLQLQSQQGALQPPLLQEDFLNIPTYY